MKENAPKKIRFQTLRTLWAPLAIGVVTVAALAVVVGMVWKDYRTGMMDSQTRQMELVVQSTADSTACFDNWGFYLLYSISFTVACIFFCSFPFIMIFCHITPRYN